MNKLKIFTYENNEIRTAQKDGVPWWVLKDVCDVLGIEKHRDAASRLDEDERGSVLVDTLGGKQEMVAVNESGLYSTILLSRKPEAKKFKRWVTHEVLPSIRKHGAYMTPETLEAAILNPDTIIRIATALKDEQERSKALLIHNSALTVENQIMAPKADYFDEIVNRHLLTGFRETAKELGVKPKMFVSFLLEKKYIFRDKKGKLMPYQPHVDSGLFEVKEGFNEKTQWSGTQTLVTPKGRETFRLLWLGATA